MTSQPSASRLIWVVAGEPSGDARGEELLRRLKLLRPDLEFIGAGGPRIRALAGEPFDDWVAEAAVVGLWDVLRHYPYFRGKFHGMLAEINTRQPAAVLLIDYPGFNLRLARALRQCGYRGKILYYISPQVWAWNRGRIPAMARFLDLMVCVFPFEQPMYQASGLKTAFTGHPMLEALMQGTEADHSERDRNLLALLPGSRRREVEKNLPPMCSAARLVLERRPQTTFAIAIAHEKHRPIVEPLLDGLPVTVSRGNAHELMRRARAGIVCSGTATLESAFFGLPYCLIYRAAWLTFEVGKRLVDVNCLGIVNILNNYLKNPPADPRIPADAAPHVVKEFIQHFALPEPMANEVTLLLDDNTYRENMLESFRTILDSLQVEGASQRAAESILSELQ